MTSNENRKLSTHKSYCYKSKQNLQDFTANQYISQTLRHITEHYEILRRNTFLRKIRRINHGISPRINLHIIQTFTSISPRIRKEFRFIRDCYQLFRTQSSTHLTETFRGCRKAHKTVKKQINGWICHHSTKSHTNIDYILIRQYCQVPLFSVFSRKHSIAIS